MARDLIRLSGKEPDKDIEIVFTGLREGEKLYEELITLQEDIFPTAHEKIMVLRSNELKNKPDGQFIQQKTLNAQVETLVNIAENYDARGIKRKLQEIVPEYSPSESESII
jgi:FlaA1/EpsC-like NDP-sugar epimerase